jgi:glutaredoxin
MEITLYSKENCSLCDEALGLLSRLANEYEFDLDVVDISESKEAWDKYRYMVPVVLVEGELRAHGRITEEKLRALLSR